MVEFKKYSLPLGDTILYKPDKTFPPGEGTIKIADLAAFDLNQVCQSSEGSAQSYKVLELGVGPGTFLVELASHLFTPDQFTFFGIDFDPLSVKLTDHNLRNIARRRHTRINSQIYEANWSIPETWDGFKGNLFHLIYFNPPYLSREASIPDKLVKIPRDMAIDKGLGGLYHYRYVLPKLPGIFSPQRGSTIIFRIPEYLNEKDLSSLDDGTIGRTLWTKMLPQIPDAEVSYYNFEPSVKGHFCKMVRL